MLTEHFRLFAQWRGQQSNSNVSPSSLASEFSSSPEGNYKSPPIEYNDQDNDSDSPLAEPLSPSDSMRASNDDLYNDSSPSLANTIASDNPILSSQQSSPSSTRANDDVIAQQLDDLSSPLSYERNPKLYAYFIFMIQLFLN